MAFDEFTFIKGLTERPYDAQRFSQFFEPSWLETAALRPVLREIFEFTTKKAIPPSIKTIRELLIAKDKFAYEQRYKATLDELDQIVYQPSDIMHQIDKATESAKANCIRTLFESHDFKKDLDSLKGHEAAKKFETLMTKFREPDGFREWDIRELVEFTNKAKHSVHRARIPCGIDVIDSWSNGGLRAKQLGIIIASTGVGKSAILTIMAYRMAAREGKRVLHISNELTGEEIGERFLPLLTGGTLDEVMENPVTDNLGTHWDAGLDNRLRCLEITKEVSIVHIESILERYKSIQGFVPEVIVLDYMERLCPALPGYDRNNTSQWFEGIAKDIVRMNKTRGIVTWTAAQVNRAGMSAKELSLAHGQGSIKHFQEADAVITVQKKQLPSNVFNHPDEKNDVALHFMCQKMRQSGSAGKEALVQANMNKMMLKKDLLSLTLLDEPDEDDEKMDKFNKGKKNGKKNS